MQHCLTRCIWKTKRKSRKVKVILIQSKGRFSYFPHFFFATYRWLLLIDTSKKSFFLWGRYLSNSNFSEVSLGLSRKGFALIPFEVQWVREGLSHRLLQWFGGKATCNIISGHMKSQFIVTNSTVCGTTELLGYLHHNLWPLEAPGCLVCSYWSSLQPVVLLA